MTATAMQNKAHTDRTVILNVLIIVLKITISKIQKSPISAYREHALTLE